MNIGPPVMFYFADDDRNSDTADGENGATNYDDNSAVPSTSTGQHSEIDAKLADFFKVLVIMPFPPMSAQSLINIKQNAPTPSHPFCKQHSHRKAYFYWHLQ